MQVGQNRVSGDNMLHIVYCYVLCSPAFIYLYTQRTQSGGREGTAVEYYAPWDIEGEVTAIQEAPQWDRCLGQMKSFTISIWPER